jgi:aspartate 1-decarboxylase
MDVFMLKSKLHQATVTDADIEYEGSISIDSALMAEVDLHPFEKVLVANMATGSRFETYVIPAAEGTGEISLNGATARLGQPGDRLIIFAFAQVPASEAADFTPKIVRLDSQNRVIKRFPAK